MDSLHPSLSQALPLRDYDAEQALQAPFRAAALGIATFYKKSAENGRKAYTLGYSSALQDVLTHLQTALDQPDSQHSQQSMALTIGRVIDYIQRRQEALRAESQEPNEEDASPAPHHRQPHSTTPSSQTALSTTEPQPRNTDNQAHTRESSNLTFPTDSCPHPTQFIRRRTSPRKTTPVTFQNSSGESSSTGPSSDSTPQALPSPPLTTGILPQPINVTFSSFAASPLPQHQQPSMISTNSLSSRRHRGVGTDGTRKGKVKERVIGTDRSPTGVSLDSTGHVPRGYSHYNSNNSSTSSTEVKSLSSVGNKRRFPMESVLAIHDSNPVAPPPASMRICRRSNPNKTLPPAPIEQTESTPTPATNLEDSIKIHHSDDAVMFLQGGDSDPVGRERPSKRFFFL